MTPNTVSNKSSIQRIVRGSVGFVSSRFCWEIKCHGHRQTLDNRPCVAQASGFEAASVKKLNAPVVVIAQPPTPNPTPKPTSELTGSPTESPTNAPTSLPTLKPSTGAPSELPTSTPTSVPTLLPCELVPGLPEPPQLELARFSDTGAGMLMVFDRPTDQGGFTAGVDFPCAEIFAFADADADKSTCYWVDAYEVMAVVSSAVGLIPGGDIVAQEGLLRHACLAPDDRRCVCFAANNETATPALTPFKPLIPTIVLQGPDTVAVCEPSGYSLRADQTTGSGGRALTFVWSGQLFGAAASESGLQAAQEALATAVSRASSESVFVALQTELAAMSEGGFEALEVRLFVANFLGSNSSMATSVLLSSLQLPSVIIGGGDQSLRRDSDLIVEAQGAATSCDGRSLVDRTVSYAWTLSVAGEASLLVSNKKNQRVFGLDAFSLEPGVDYTLAVVVTDEAFKSTNKAEIQIQVESGGVVAVIDGGDRVVSFSEVFDLSAGSSYDENVADDFGENAGLTFEWRCVVAEATEADGQDEADYCSGMFSTEESLTLDASDLGAGLFRFSVIVNSTLYQPRTSSAAVTYRVSEGLVPNVFVMGYSGSVNAALKATVAGTIASPDDLPSYTYSLESRMVTSWTVSPAKSMSGGKALSELALTPIVLSTAFVVGSNVELGHDLVLAKDALVPGATYVFTLEARSDITDQVGSASVTVKVARPPTSGNVVVTPSTGMALVTQFSASAKKWVASELPLAYQFNSWVVVSAEIKLLFKLTPILSF